MIHENMKTWLMHAVYANMIKTMFISLFAYLTAKRFQFEQQKTCSRKRSTRFLWDKNTITTCHCRQIKSHS